MIPAGRDRLEQGTSWPLHATHPTANFRFLAAAHSMRGVDSSPQYRKEQPRWVKNGIEGTGAHAGVSEFKQGWLIYAGLGRTSATTLRRSFDPQQ